LRIKTFTNVTERLTNGAWVDKTYMGGILRASQARLAVRSSVQCCERSSNEVSNLFYKLHDKAYNQHRTTRPVGAIQNYTQLLLAVVYRHIFTTVVDQGADINDTLIKILLA
jgi:hypothetical protein